MTKPRHSDYAGVPIVNVKKFEGLPCASSVYEQEILAIATGIADANTRRAIELLLLHVREANSNAFTLADSQTEPEVGKRKSDELAPPSPRVATHASAPLSPLVPAQGGLPDADRAAVSKPTSSDSTDGARHVTIDAESLGRCFPEAALKPLQSALQSGAPSFTPCVKPKFTPSRSLSRGHGEAAAVSRPCARSYRRVVACGTEIDAVALLSSQSNFPKSPAVACAAPFEATVDVPPWHRSLPTQQALQFVEKVEQCVSLASEGCIVAMGSEQPKATPFAMDGPAPSSELPLWLQIRQSTPTMVS